MRNITCHMSISLDGFVAGSDRAGTAGLASGGGKFLAGTSATSSPLTPMRPRLGGPYPRGAYVMGRDMFGATRGEWDEDWRGWWSDERLYHAPLPTHMRYRRLR
jgi:hypothetical protein